MCNTFYFDVDEVRMDTKGQVARQRPGCGRPCDDAHGGVLIEGEGDNHCSGRGTLGGGGGEGGLEEKENQSDLANLEGEAD